MNDTAAAILKATAALRDGTEKLRFEAPVHVTYNPLTYAWNPHEQYVRTYGNGEKGHLFLGMNPGPFGMAQTGVPFGEVDAVVNWLHIRGEVGRPEHTHPKRPVEGFGCPRSEVSGRRLWGLFAEAFGTAENFFRHNYVANYCPLIWMGATGANITPDKLPTEQRAAVDAVCMEHLLSLITILNPHTLVGVGAYATQKLRDAASRLPGKSFTIGTLLHPSPASPIANKLWPERPIQHLRNWASYKKSGGGRVENSVTWKESPEQQAGNRQFILFPSKTTSL